MFVSFGINTFNLMIGVKYALWKNTAPVFAPIEEMHTASWSIWNVDAYP